MLFNQQIILLPVFFDFIELVSEENESEKDDEAPSVSDTEVPLLGESSRFVLIFNFPIEEFEGGKITGTLM